MLIIDAFAFCRGGEHQTGKLTLPMLPRLRAECVSDVGEVEWDLAGNQAGNAAGNAAGSIAARGHPILRWTINGKMQLMCQRCLTPFDFHIQSESTMLLAVSDDAADQIEASLDDDEIEVIVGNKSFDILALIEDEALLAIPLSPKHEVCPEKEKLDAFAIAKKESPFAALKKQIK